MEVSIKDIDINITFKRIRNIYLRIDRKTGKIYISAPLRTNMSVIESFVSSKSNWIRQRQVDSVKYKERNPALRYENGEIIKILGKEYTILTVQKPSKKVLIDDNNCTITIAEQDNIIAKEKIINAYYKKVLNSVIKDRLPYWENKLNLHSSGYIIRNMKTRWGTCNIKTKRITFNLQLCKKELECIDYIIVHELGHIIISNHGVEFKKYMNNNYPNWKEIKKQLNL